jgi:asparagine synthase (glutamine-hydrolysing)
MSGIVGCFGSRDEKTINRMLDALAPQDHHEAWTHTAPKMAWAWKGDGVSSHPPAFNIDKSKGVIVSGEIDNLQSLGAPWAASPPVQNHADAEAILALYEQRGPDCVRDLDGIFALALYDRERDTFMLARDPIGIKSLYYGYRDATIFFATDSRAFALAAVEDVHEFPPGHYYTPADGFIRYYWLPQVDKKPLVNAASMALRIHKGLTRSVQKRVMSAALPARMGACCTGDLASSIVVALAARETPHLQTFAVGPVDQDGNDGVELQKARQLAAHVGCRHLELAVGLKEYKEALHQVIHHLQSHEPAVVRPAVPWYLMTQLAAGHADVLLTGTGADELFAGHPALQEFALAQVNEECRRRISALHLGKLQRRQQLARYCNLEMRLPFLDKDMISLAMKISAGLKIKELADGAKISKWIVRQAFADSTLLPEGLFGQDLPRQTGWQAMVGAWAESEISREALSRLHHDNPGAKIDSKETALYFKILRHGHC